MTDSFADANQPTPSGTAQTLTFARDAVLRLGADLNGLYADATFAAMFAIDAEALSGKPLATSSLPKPMVAILITLAQGVLAEGLPRRAQATWQHDGHSRDFDLLALPERTTHGPIHAVMFCIGAAPARLEEVRARHAQAEAAVFSRDRLLSIASHDLRGPLNAIHSWSHVLERKLTLDDPALQRALAGIRTGVEQQVKLIEKVLDAPRAATRALAITRRPIAVRRLVDDVLANLRATFAGLRGTPIEAELRLAHEHLNGDHERLWQALWIALAYAVEASEPGSVVKLDASDAESAWRLTIAYYLSLPTLADITVAHAFEPFVRDEVSHARRPNEVALALNLPKLVIEAHGGEFSAQPAAGAGELSFVKLSIPLT